MDENLSSIEDDLAEEKSEMEESESPSQSETPQTEEPQLQAPVSKPGVWQPKFKQRQAQAEDFSSKEGIFEAEKQLRSVLNRVSEGNIDPMFTQLSEIMSKAVSAGKVKRD